MKKGNLNARIKELQSLDDIIKEHKKDPEFETLLNMARLRVSIARQIKIAREKAGLTQSELAEALDMTQPMIGRLESLKDKRIPSIELLFRIVTITKEKLVLNQSGVHMELAVNGR